MHRQKRRQPTSAAERANYRTDVIGAPDNNKRARAHVNTKYDIIGHVLQAPPTYDYANEKCAVTAGE